MKNSTNGFDPLTLIFVSEVSFSEIFTLIFLVKTVK